MVGTALGSGESRDALSGLPTLSLASSCIATPSGVSFAAASAAQACVFGDCLVGVAGVDFAGVQDAGLFSRAWDLLIIHRLLSRLECGECCGVDGTDRDGLLRFIAISLVFAFSGGLCPTSGRMYPGLYVFLGDDGCDFGVEEADVPERELVCHTRKRIGMCPWPADVDPSASIGSVPERKGRF